MIIESDKGKVFGGFTNIAWKAEPYWRYHNDPDAFIFSLTHGTVHHQIDNNNSSVGHSMDWFIVFGNSTAGDDICIYRGPECQSYCMAESAYDMSNVTTHDRLSYLSGSNRLFSIVNVELFRVKFI